MKFLTFYNPWALVSVIFSSVLFGVLIGFFIGLLYFTRIKGDLLARQHNKIKQLEKTNTLIEEELYAHKAKIKAAIIALSSGSL